MKFKVLQTVLFLVLVFGSLKNWASTCTFTGSSNSSWENASNWDCGIVPTASDNAIINLSSTSYISITGSVAVNNLTFTGDGIYATNPSTSSLTINGVFTFLSGRLQVNSTIAASGTLNVTTGSDIRIVNALLTNNGTINVFAKFGEEYALNSGLGRIINNGTLNFNSAGIFRQSAFTNSSTGIINFNSTDTSKIAFSSRNTNPSNGFYNDGTINVIGGHLKILSGFIQRAGVLYVPSGHTFTAGRNTYDQFSNIQEVVFEGGVINGGGEMVAENTGYLRFDFALTTNMAFRVRAGGLFFGNGSRLSGTITIEGISYSSFGTYSDGSIISLTSTCVLNLYESNNINIEGIVQNAGTINWQSGNLTCGLTVRSIFNLSSGIFNFNSTGLLSSFNVHNAGTINVNTARTFTQGFRVDSTGIINFNQPCVFNYPSIYIDGTLNITNNLTIDNIIIPKTGNVNWQLGTLNINSLGNNGTFTSSTSTSKNLQFGSTSLGIYNSETGTMTLTNINMTRADIVNYGAMTLNNFTLNSGTKAISVTNNSAADFFINGSVAINGTTTFRNNHNLSINGTLTLGAGTNFRNNHNLSINGTLTLGAGTNFTNDPNATIKGSGTLNRTNATSVVMAGNINPGNSPGILNIVGNLDFDHTIYNCEINGDKGDQYDRIVISGDAILTYASLNVTWGFTPTAGTTFTILSAGNAINHFLSFGVTIPPITGLIFTTYYSGTDVTIDVTAAPSCGLPNNFQSSGIDIETADLSWVAVSGATNYEVRVKKNSELNWTTYPVSITSKHLINLDGNTSYSAQVRTVCKGGSSFGNWADPVSFQTLKGTKQDGNWNDPNTWWGGEIPNPNPYSFTIVKNNVTVNTNDAVCSNLTVRSGTITVATNGILSIMGDISVFLGGSGLNVNGGIVTSLGQLNFSAGSSIALIAGNISINGAGDFITSFGINTSSLFIHNDATTSFTGGTLQIFPPSALNHSPIIETNKVFGDYAGCSGTKVILSGSSGNSGVYNLGNSIYRPTFVFLKLKAQTTNLDYVAVKNLTVDGGTVNFGNTPNNEVGSIIRLNAPTILGAYTSIPFCPNIITSQQTGKWTDASTWDSGTVPSATDDVIVKDIITHEGTAPGFIASCRNLTINAGGTILQKNTLNISGDLTINAGGRFLNNPNNAYYPYTVTNIGTLNSFGAVDAPGTNLINCTGELYLGGNNTSFNLGGRMIFNTGSTLTLGDQSSSVLYGWSGSTPEYLMDIDNLTTLNLFSTSPQIRVNGNAVGNTKQIISPGRTFKSASCSTSRLYTLITLFPSSKNSNNYYFGNSAGASQTIAAITSRSSNLYLNNNLVENLLADSKSYMYSNASKFNDIDILDYGNGPIVFYGDYTFTSKCNGGWPTLNFTSNNLATQASTILNVNVNDSMIIIVNNTSAMQTLLGQFNMQSGKVIVKSGTLDLRTATVSGLNAVRYFETKDNGKVLLQTAVGTNEVKFNLGLSLTNPNTGVFGSIYAPIVITSTSGTTDISINVQPLTLPTGFVAPQIQWNITPLASGSSPNLNIIFTWPASIESTAFAALRNKAKAYHFNGLTWEELTSSLAHDNLDGTFSIAVANVSSFSPFAILAPDVPTPIELLNFTAQAKGANAELNWQTATEVNALNFEIEKSTNGTHFEKIGEVAANNAPSKYTFLDENFSQSCYFRLRNNDVDGKFDYSKVVYVDKNPSTPLKIKSNTFGEIVIETVNTIELVNVVNALGQIVKTGKEKQFSIADLPTGIYTIVVYSDKLFASEKVFNVRQ